MLFHVNNKHQDFLIQPKSEDAINDTSTNATVSLPVQYYEDEDQAKLNSAYIEDLDLSLFLGRENQQIPVEEDNEVSLNGNHFHVKGSVIRYSKSLIFQV